ncbi:MAG TPA: CoA transferase [Gemmatimonadota bacterium]|nr:CoA transferase [Gemmatimonadota bacterium]
MPLSGIRVIDLTRILAGPYATMILGDMGADVIKIENPDGGDDSRAWGPPWVPQTGGASAYFTAVNRNKRSVALDLKGDAGREALWRLIDGADVLVSNFRPGVIERLGFSWEAVHARAPRLVYALVNGYGATGPGAAKPSFDVIVQGESGVMDVTGWPDGPPTRVGISLGDEAAGLLVVQGILAALFARERTGEGQRVEVALHDGLLSLLTYHAQNWWAGGPQPTRLGNAHPSIVPYQTFRAADAWINVGVGNERQWRAFCELAGRVEWIEDPRYATNGARVTHRDELVPLLEALFASRTAADWLDALRAAGIPSGRIRHVPEALESPEARHREMVVEVESDAGGPLRLLGVPVKLSATPGRIRRRPPALGEHTEEVLSEIGYDSVTIESLRTRGAI